MEIKPSSEIKPLQKLNREFMIEILSESQDITAGNTINIINTVDSVDFESADVESESELESDDLIKPIIIDIEIELPEPVNNKITAKEILEIFAHTNEENENESQPDKKIKNNQKTEKIEKIEKIKNPVKKRNVFSFISDALFYLAILTVMIAILTSGTKEGAPKTFMGKYAYFTVLTQSMQNEIPKGSFILVKNIDPHELQIGDNITFMRDATTSVTHKINDIYENYNDSGSRGFQTKGTNNANPDSEIIYEANVVGKVMFHIPKLGAIITELRSNIYIVFIIFGVFIAVSFLLRWLFNEMGIK